MLVNKYEWRRVKIFQGQRVIANWLMCNYFLFLHMTKLRNWWTFEGIISCTCASYFSIFWNVLYNSEILCFLEVWWNSYAVVPECGFLCENFWIIVALSHFPTLLLLLFLRVYFHFLSVFKMFGIQLFIVLS